MGSLFDVKREGQSPNTVKLSLPLWGRWHAKRDGEGISCGICPLTRLRRELSQRESLFSFFLT